MRALVIERVVVDVLRGGQALVTHVLLEVLGIAVGRIEGSPRVPQPVQRC